MSQPVEEQNFHKGTFTNTETLPTEISSHVAPLSPVKSEEQEMYIKQYHLRGCVAPDTSDDLKGRELCSSRLHMDINPCLISYLVDN